MCSPRAPAPLAQATKGSDTEQWKLIWCHERCYKAELSDFRLSLTEAADKAGYEVICFKKVTGFKKWIAEVAIPPSVLLTDWREAKPCVEVLDKSQTTFKVVIVYVSDDKQLRAASKWAQALPAQEHVRIIRSRSDPKDFTAHVMRSVHSAAGREVMAQWHCRPASSVEPKKPPVLRSLSLQNLFDAGESPNAKDGKSSDTDSTPVASRRGCGTNAAHGILTPPPPGAFSRERAASVRSGKSLATDSTAVVRQVHGSIIAGRGALALPPPGSFAHQTLNAKSSKRLANAPMKGFRQPNNSCMKAATSAPAQPPPNSFVCERARVWSVPVTRVLASIFPSQSCLEVSNALSVAAPDVYND